MTPFYADENVTLWHGDALQVLLEMPDDSVDAVVTDPPYGLEFMGREWDGADGFRRSLNGADVGRDSVFGRTSRTSPEYRTGKPAAARIRTRVDGRTNPAEGKSTTSTPESYVAGPVYQQWCQAWAQECLRVLKPGGHLLAFGGTRTVHRLTCAIEDAGFEIRDGIDWIYGSGFPKSLNLGDGLGTALKPAREPIVVARKPLVGTVAANVEQHGTGALNIDACRVPVTDEAYARNCSGDRGHADNRTRDMDFAMTAGSANDAGRWPSNVILSHAGNDTDGDLRADGCVSGCPVAELDLQSGVLTSGANPTRRSSDKFRDAFGDFKGQAECIPARGADHGGASRFFPVFRYEAKAPASERPRVDGVAHPTVKPLALMRWLVRLVTPPGGLVLDPFVGSGTTAEACVVEGFRCIAVEREADYLPLIKTRLSKPLQPTLAFDALAGA